MSRRSLPLRLAAAAVLVVAVTGCSQRAPTADSGDWRATTEQTPEGTVVRTLGDDRLYVLDQSASAVRVYDFSGVHLVDLGRKGDGPGEFDSPFLLAADRQGAVYVRDLTSVEKFGLSGASEASWRAPGSGVVLPMVATSQGTLMVPGAGSVDGRQVLGWLPIGRDGTSGHFVAKPMWDGWRPWQLEAHGHGRVSVTPVPYAPQPSWSLTPSGKLVEIDGAAYRVTLTDAAGVRTVIEREILTSTG